MTLFIHIWVSAQLTATSVAVVYLLVRAARVEEALLHVADDRLGRTDVRVRAMLQGRPLRRDRGAPPSVG